MKEKHSKNDLILGIALGSVTAKRKKLKEKHSNERSLSNAKFKVRRDYDPDEAGICSDIKRYAARLRRKYGK